MSNVEMVNVKLTGASRFISPPCGITSVVTRNQIIPVTAAQGAYLCSLTKKDRSNNPHPTFVVTEEDATASADARMTEQERLAKAVREEAEAEEVEEVEEVKEVAKPAPKRRAKKTSGTRGTRNASKVVA